MTEPYKYKAKCNTVSCNYKKNMLKSKRERLVCEKFNEIIYYVTISIENL